MINQYNTQFEKQLDEEYLKAQFERDHQREEIIKWLASCNTRYHLTITFIEETSEYWNRKLLNRLLIHLNRAIYKNRYTRGQNYIKGFAIREATPGFNTDHYHLLLRDHEWIPEYKRMNELVDKQIKYFGYNKKNNQSKKKYISTYCLQDYYNLGDDGLEGYLTKKFYFLSNPMQKCLDSIGTLTAGDVIFGRDKFDH